MKLATLAPLGCDFVNAVSRSRVDPRNSHQTGTLEGAPKCRVEGDRAASWVGDAVVSVVNPVATAGCRAPRKSGGRDAQNEGGAPQGTNENKS
jgi:hypothetical protein